MPLDLPTLTAAFVAGLLGGLHCAAMCGGIATGFPAMAPGPAFSVALQANLGRIGSYIVAGALVGGIGGGMLRLLRSDALALGLRMAAICLGDTTPTELQRPLRKALQTELERDERPATTGDTAIVDEALLSGLRQLLQA